MKKNEQRRAAPAGDSIEKIDLTPVAVQLIGFVRNVGLEDSSIPNEKTYIP